MQRIIRTSEMREKDLRQQIDDLRTDNEKQQKLIGQVLWEKCGENSNFWGEMDKIFSAFLAVKFIVKPLVSEIQYD